MSSELIPLNDKYKLGFLNQVEASQRGEVTSIPVSLSRVGEVFNLMQSRYTLLSGATGAGKTSFADSLYVLNPWTYFNSTTDDIHWECIYFSLERKQMFKHAKWVSWMIYRDHKIIVSADDLMGWGKNPVNKKGYALIRSYDDEMSRLLQHVHIYDGKVSSTIIIKAINSRALQLGELFYSDDVYVYRQNNIAYYKSFEEDGVVEHTPIGDKVYIPMEYKGTKFKMYQNSHQYFLHNPKTFVYIMIDGIGLLGGKEILDEVSVACADARDKYGFSPVIVTQQNRAMGDIQRMKAHGGDLSPQLEDIFKSSQMGFDADLVIGLFDPYRYKAWDENGKYMGYIVNPMDNHITTHSMLSPTGQSRFRSMHILKNTFGGDGNVFAMKFLGECNYFEVLPFPDDPRMGEIYADIRCGI